MGQHYVRSSPTGPLAAAVGSMLGYEITDDAPSVHRGLPSPWLTLVISLDGPVPTATAPDQDAPLHRYESLVGGLHTTPAYIHQPAHQAGSSSRSTRSPPGRCSVCPLGSSGSSRTPTTCSGGPRATCASGSARPRRGPGASRWSRTRCDARSPPAARLRARSGRRSPRPGGSCCAPADRSRCLTSRRTSGSARASSRRSSRPSSA
ncbi:hypothetical protein NKG05_25560 [Oerskovia sp. M15]